MKIGIFSTSKIATDQRIQKVSNTLSANGYSVTIYCRKHNKIGYKSENIKIKFINTIFDKGPLFYLQYNIQIFFKILFSRFDIIYCNDLDTLTGCALGSAMRNKKLIYDSHELFTEVPELVNRSLIKLIWRIQEKVFIRKANAIITVSDGVASELTRRYKVKEVNVIRNLPVIRETEVFKDKQPTIIYQGSLNVGRGIELAIEMMKHLPCYKLLIVGSGDIEIQLRKQMLESNLYDRVQFLGQLPPHELRLLTPTAWLGLSLEEDLGLNYRYALPNKLFDYIAAQVPVLVSDLPEMRKVVEKYKVGIVAKSRKPAELANQIGDFFDDKQEYESALKNIKSAVKDLNWQNEESKLIEVVKRVAAS